MIVRKRLLSAPHWLPSFIYLDEELLLNGFSDLTGKLPTEMSRAKEGGLHLPGAGVSGASTHTLVFKRYYYLDALVAALELQKDKNFGLQTNRPVLAFVMLDPTLLFKDKKRGLLTVALEGGNDLWLRTEDLDPIALTRIDALTSDTYSVPPDERRKLEWGRCLVIGMRVPNDIHSIRALCGIALDTCLRKERWKRETPLDELIDRAVMVRT